MKDNVIDDLLDEIDEKEKGQTSTESQDEQKQLWIKWIEDGLVFGCNYKQPPFMRRGLSKTIWGEILINLKVSSDKTEGFNKIYDQMPKEHYRAFPGSKLEGDYNQDNFKDLAEWAVAYKTDENNKHDELFHDVFDRIINYGFWSEFRNKVCWGTLDEIVKYYEQFEDKVSINDACLIDGMTLLHKCSEWGKAPVTDWLLSFKNIIIDQKNDEGKTALDIAKEKGHWDIVSKLTFASMGDKMREKTDTQIAKLNRMEGMIKQWFRFYNVDDTKSNEYKSMVKMCESIKNLIKERLPVSDDLLMLCLHFELKQNNNNPLNCSIWNTLYNVLNECLRIPLNRRNWLWFKQYIFDCSIWFQKFSAMDEQKEEKKEDKLLYNLLIDMVSKQLKAQRDYLEPYIDKLENETKEDNQSWNDLKNYPEFIVTDNPQGLRQDECVEKGTGKELLTYPIRPIFSDHQLRKLNEKVKEFNPHHHFDVHGYLSKLVLVAHSLNDTFHKTMRQIFNVDKYADTNYKDGLTYHEGPVKRLARSQAKAETDYASASYPSTAKIIDFIRCCLVYDNPSNLLKGIQKFMDIVNRDNTAILCNGRKCGEKLIKLPFSDVIKDKDYFICTDCRKRATVEENKFIYHCPAGNTGAHVFGYHLCAECSSFRLNSPLKKVLRVKNMMLESKRENNGKWDLYRYADVKMGVLMEFEGQSMIVEVQFLLNFMLKAKGLGHGLYEIERNKDFIYDVEKIRQLQSGGNDSIGGSLREAVVTNNENELATLILNYAPLDLTKLDDNNQSLIHLACEKGNKKTLKFILATVEADGTSDDLKLMLNKRDTDPDYDANNWKKLTPPIHIVIERQHVTLLNILLKYNELDIHALDHRKRTPLFKMVTDTALKYGKIAKMWNVLKKDKRTKQEWGNIDEEGNTFFINCCGYEEDVEFVKMLWESGLYKINDTNSRGQTALIRAATHGRIETIKFLLEIPELDLNIAQNSMSAIDMAITNRNFSVIKLLYNDKRLDWKAGKRNKFAMACETHDLEMVKLILSLWPEIDVNKPDEGAANQSAVQAAAGTNEEILEFVLAIPGIKVDEVSDTGFSPWLMAIERKRLGNAKILWKRKDIDFYRKRDGKNALEWAEQFSNKKVIEFLKDIGFNQK